MPEKTTWVSRSGVEHSVHRVYPATDTIVTACGQQFTGYAEGEGEFRRECQNKACTEAREGNR